MCLKLYICLYLLLSCDAVTGMLKFVIGNFHFLPFSLTHPPQLTKPASYSMSKLTAADITLKLQIYDAEARHALQAGTVASFMAKKLDEIVSKALQQLCPANENFTENFIQTAKKWEP